MTECSEMSSGQLTTENDVMNNAPISFEEPLESVVTQEDCIAAIECKVKGHPAPTCVWFKDGLPIQQSCRIRTIVTGKFHRLIIRHAKPCDHGLYCIVCKNTNSHASSQAVIHVGPARNFIGTVRTFYTYPKHTNGVVKHLSQMTIKAGERITLKAEFQKRARDCQWFKNNHPILRDVTIRNNKNTSEFIIDRARVTDTGVYTVVNRSRYGIVSSFSEVRVIEGDLTNDAPSIIDHLPEEIETNDREEMRLVCKVSIDDNTKVEWTKNGVPIKNSKMMVYENYGNYAIGLRIREPSLKDKGYYSVVLRNKVTGRVATSTCDLSVRLNLKNEPAVEVRKSLESVVAAVGSTVSFCCSFRMPDPQYYYVVWYIGLCRVERNSTSFQVIYEESDDDYCKATLSYLLLINQLEPDMAGEVSCELRKVLALPNQRSVLAARTVANLTIVPPCLINLLELLQSGRKRHEMSYKRTTVLLQEIYENVENVYESLEDDFQKEVNAHEADVACTELAEITYCRLQEDLHFLEVSRAIEQISRVEAYEKLDRDPEDDCEKVVIVRWSQKDVSKIWYAIDIVQPNGTFFEAGLSSEPQFEIMDPPVGKLVSFLIRPCAAFDAYFESRVCIWPSTSQEVVTPWRDVPLQDLTFFNHFYVKMGEQLGRGAFGSVELVNNEAGQQFAAKVIELNIPRRSDMAMKEYSIMRRLNHPKVVTLVAAFQSPKRFILVMEFLWGGELLERVVNEEHFQEADAMAYIKQILEALQYLHDMSLVHLDLKPDNVVCLSPNSNQVKIIDFGLAKDLSEGRSFQTFYGTRDYMSPEILSFDRVTVACDMWSLGVVTYILLSGMMPFAGDTWASRTFNITLAQYDFNDTVFDDISELAKDFVRHLLVLEPGNRFTATEALQHPWIQGPPLASNYNYTRRIKENLRAFLATYKACWQRAGNAVIAAQRMRAQAYSSTKRNAISENVGSPLPGASDLSHQNNESPESELSANNFRATPESNSDDSDTPISYSDLSPPNNERSTNTNYVCESCAINSGATSENNSNISDDTSINVSDSDLPVPNNEISESTNNVREAHAINSDAAPETNSVTSDDDATTITDSDFPRTNSINENNRVALRSRNPDAVREWPPQGINIRPRLSRCRLELLPEDDI